LRVFGCGDHPGHAVEAADPGARREIGVRSGEAQRGREVLDGLKIGAALGCLGRANLGFIHAGFPQQIGRQISGRGEGEQVWARGVEVQNFLGIVQTGIRGTALLGSPAAGTEQCGRNQQQRLPTMSSCHAMFSRMQDLYL